MFVRKYWKNPPTLIRVTGNVRERSDANGVFGDVSATIWSSQQQNETGKCPGVPKWLGYWALSAEESRPGRCTSVKMCPSKAHFFHFRFFTSRSANAGFVCRLTEEGAPVRMGRSEAMGGVFAIVVPTESLWE